ncbi:MAG: malto-oligosyltrehalose trehalohydrolase [Chloroflexi bacterium RBG_16_50_9]|nr:MAG: malto-oligosyltrehalose trehalohydrolase [Chloroflexi bacterium RBG_16_50_9]
MRLGATFKDGVCRFLVWAPLAEKVEAHIIAPEERLLPLAGKAYGYHSAVLEEVAPGSLYFYRLDGSKDYPDPASRCQPQGVHGPSQAVAPAFPWEERHWPGMPLQQYIIYELHVGSFTAEGTFEAIIPCLDELKKLGITAIELMPVAQFPGARNWGYDGVYPYAVQNTYGGPAELKRLVNACHQRQMAVILDVVYNHLGPEGNYLGQYAPYFTDRYRTPWGTAINFDGPFSDDVRRYFIENALYWLQEFHIDALRLDALHAILDTSATPFLEELSTSAKELAEQLDRQIYLIGESDANDRRLIMPPELGGYGLNAQWNEGFHHSLHVLLTGEKNGYYQDFGQVRHLVKAFREGFVYSGQYSPYRKRRHGSSSLDIPAQRFVVFAQNHDQVGNRMLGDRLSQVVSFEGTKLAAGVVLLSPFIPLIFMGDEYGETAPFQYFTSHSDAVLIEAVRRGRREEFVNFRWQGEPPDPHDESTFLRAKLNHALRHEGQHRVLRGFYQELIHIRREVPALSSLNKDNLKVLGYEKNKMVFVLRWNEGSQAIAVFHFGDTPSAETFPVPAGRWRKRLDSADRQWLGKGSRLPQKLDSKGKVTITMAPKSFALFTNSEEA